MEKGNTWINAAVGAAITFGLSFTGVSPLLGGGVAGYLQRESPMRGARVGALSGAIAAAPLFLLMTFGLVAHAWVFPGMAGMPGGLELLVIFAVMLPMIVLWFVGLSAAGGYLGAYLRADARPPSRDVALEQ